jgi:hypothetical protein
LTSIKTRVTETVKFVTNYQAQDKILSKSMRGKFISNVKHTKPKAKGKQNAENDGTAPVFPTQNRSPIGAICKATTQTHPGKATSKTNLNFCKWCGIEVGSK